MDIIQNDVWCFLNKAIISATMNNHVPLTKSTNCMPISWHWRSPYSINLLYFDVELLWTALILVSSICCEHLWLIVLCICLNEPQVVVNLFILVNTTKDQHSVLVRFVLVLLIPHWSVVCNSVILQAHHWMHLKLPNETDIAFDWLLGMVSIDRSRHPFQIYYSRSINILLALLRSNISTWS